MGSKKGIFRILEKYFNLFFIIGQKALKFGILKYVVLQKIWMNLTLETIYERRWRTTDADVSFRVRSTEFTQFQNLGLNE